VRPRIPVWAIAGEDVEFWFDQELGIVLRYEGRFEGELISRFEIDELVVGQPMDSATFAFDTPDGSPVRSEGEMLLERLKSRGIDITSIDPEDPVQVQEAMRSNLGGGHTPVDIEQLAAQHIPKGPPPSDEAAARRDIERAWEHMGERSKDGAGLVNVERGENLGPTSEEIQKRFPQYVYEGAGTPPEKIKFLGSTEAVVWSRHPVIGIREGRAVLVDGKWKVSRATWSGLLAGAGIVCPPPL
jgi:RNase P/RNase MRP subunit p29